MILGSGGVLVVLVLVVVGLMRGYAVPKVLYEASEERTKALDAENAKLNDAFVKMTGEVAELKAINARLEERVKHLAETLESLKGGSS